MEIAILAFDRITALDAVGPFEVLSRLPGARVRWVGPRAGTAHAERGMRIALDGTLEDVSCADLLLVPGGHGVRALQDQPRVLDWLRAVHETTRVTAAVCTGSLLLAAAGLLTGLEATTHWARRDSLASAGAIPVARRVVRQGKIYTAAGVSAGIDMALMLAADLHGETLAQAIQLGLEYDPQPPFDAGDPARVAAELRDLVVADLDRAAAG